MDYRRLSPLLLPSLAVLALTALGLVSAALLQTRVAPGLPFRILGPDTLIPGQAATITWDTSTEGARKFPREKIEACTGPAFGVGCTTLAADTPNDGDAAVIVPGSLPKGKAYIRLTARGPGGTLLAHLSSSRAVTVAAATERALIAGTRVSLRWHATNPGQYPTVKIESCVGKQRCTPIAHAVRNTGSATVRLPRAVPAGSIQLRFREPDGTLATITRAVGILATVAQVEPPRIARRADSPAREERGGSGEGGGGGGASGAGGGGSADHPQLLAVGGGPEPGGVTHETRPLPINLNEDIDPGQTGVPVVPAALPPIVPPPAAPVPSASPSPTAPPAAPAFPAPETSPEPAPPSPHPPPAPPPPPPPAPPRIEIVSAPPPVVTRGITVPLRVRILHALGLLRCVRVTIDGHEVPGVVGVPACSP